MFGWTPTQLWPGLDCSFSAGSRRTRDAVADGHCAEVLRWRFVYCFSVTSRPRSVETPNAGQANTLAETRHTHYSVRYDAATLPLPALTLACETFWSGCRGTAPMKRKPTAPRWASNTCEALKTGPGCAVSSSAYLARKRRVPERPIFRKSSLDVTARTPGPRDIRSPCAASGRRNPARRFRPDLRMGLRGMGRQARAGRAGRTGRPPLGDMNIRDCGNRKGFRCTAYLATSGSRPRSRLES